MLMASRTQKKHSPPRRVQRMVQLLYKPNGRWLIL